MRIGLSTCVLSTVCWILFVQASLCWAGRSTFQPRQQAPLLLWLPVSEPTPHARGKESAYRLPQSIHLFFLIYEFDEVSVAETTTESLECIFETFGYQLHRVFLLSTLWIITNNSNMRRNTPWFPEGFDGHVHKQQPVSPATPACSRK